MESAHPAGKQRKAEIESYLLADFNEALKISHRRRRHNRRIYLKIRPDQMRADMIKTDRFYRLKILPHRALVEIDPIVQPVF